jgi:PIN domain nuclease of toxin-antitoxin system
MRVLLDTQVWLWMWGEPERLRNEARTIVDPATELHVSAVSAWEIATKFNAGRLRLPNSAEAWLSDPTTSPGRDGASDQLRARDPRGEPASTPS